MTQPINSGAPTPVQGVTGGPGLPQGVAGVEGTTGNVVVTPPSNTLQVRKGDSPQSIQVYEFYHSQTDNVRLELLTATGGPETIGVRAAPAGVTRDLNIVASGNGRVTIPALQLPFTTLTGSSTTALAAGQFTDIPGTTSGVLATGTYFIIVEIWVMNTGGICQFNANLCPSTTGTGGSPTTLTGLGGVQVSGANTPIYQTIQSVITLATAQALKLQISSNVAGGQGNGRYTYLKIG